MLSNIVFSLVMSLAGLNEDVKPVIGIEASKDTRRQIVAHSTKEDLKCLTETIYYEARGDSKIGKKAVADVVLNRVKDKRFPNTICGVVYQPKQFSWTSRKYAVKEHDMWDEAKRIAALKINNEYHGNRTDHSKGALYFSTGYHHKGTTKIGKIGDHHLFFSQR